MLKSYKTLPPTAWLYTEHPKIQNWSKTHSLHGLTQLSVEHSWPEPAVKSTVLESRAGEVVGTHCNVTFPS